MVCLTTEGFPVHFYSLTKGERGKMMLYMALLIFLLLVVLYQVYMMTEAFAQYSSDQARIAAQHPPGTYVDSTPSVKMLPAFSPTANTKVSEGSTFLTSLASTISQLQKRVSELPSVVTDVTLTDDEMKAFEFIKNPDPANPGSTVLQMPMTSNDTTAKYFDKTTAKDYIVKRLDFDSKQLADVQSKLSTSAPTDTLVSVAAKVYGNPAVPTMILGSFPQMYAKAQTIYGFYDKFAKRNTIVPKTNSTTTTTVTTYTNEPKTIDYTQMPTDETTKANSVRNIKTGSLWPAIGPIGSASSARGHETTDQTTTVPDSTPAETPVVDISEETEKRIVKDIMTQLKDKRLLDRSLDNPQDSSYSDERPGCSSDSTEQGSEWKHTRPDMSKYIRKDSIPCWNCSP
jgi:hypothetical protein